MMDIVEWRDEFRTGIDTLDREHQRLIDERNDLVILLNSEQLSFESLKKKWIFF